MVVKATQERVSALIKDTITLLCKNGLEFTTKFTIDATIGVTLDDKDIFLVSMNELVNADGAPPEKRAGSTPDTTSEKQRTPEHKSHKRKHSETVMPVKVKTEPGTVDEATSDTINEEPPTFKTEPRATTSRTEFPSGYTGDDTSSHSYNTDRLNEPAIKTQRSVSPDIEDDEDSEDIVFVKQEGSETPRSSCSYQTPSFMGFSGDPGGSSPFSMPQMNFSQDENSLWTPPHPARIGGRGMSTASRGEPSQLGSPGDGSMQGSQGRLKEDSLQCGICGKLCTSRLTLQRHIDQHSGKYIYYCPHCNKGFNSSGTLKGHVSWHTGVKEFKCDICEKEFRYKNHLKSHFHKVHGIDLRSRLKN